MAIFARNGKMTMSRNIKPPGIRNGAYPLFREERLCAINLSS
jgi:hypothetical protein